MGGALQKTEENQQDNTVVPCYNCVCVAVCRHKTYDDLYSQCQILNDYLNWALRGGGFPDSEYSVFTWLVDILKPTQWTTQGGDVYRKGNVIK